MKGRAQHRPSCLPTTTPEYERVINIDLHRSFHGCSSPPAQNTKPVTEFADVKIDQAVIGSCTNGRIETCALPQRF